MAFQLTNGDDALRDAYDQRAGGLHLEESGMRNLELIGERAHYNVGEGLACRLLSRQQCIHQRLRNLTPKLWHGIAVRRLCRSGDSSGQLFPAPQVLTLSGNRWRPLRDLNPRPQD